MQSASVGRPKGKSSEDDDDDSVSAFEALDAIPIGGDRGNNGSGSDTSGTSSGNNLSNATNGASNKYSVNNCSNGQQQQQPKSNSVHGHTTTNHGPQHSPPHGEHLLIQLQTFIQHHINN